MWDECNCAVVWAFLDICLSLSLEWKHLFQSCGHCWVFPICWHIECSTFTSSSFRIWNSSTGIPSPPLAFFVVMFPKAWPKISKLQKKGKIKICRPSKSRVCFPQPCGVLAVKSCCSSKPNALGACLPSARPPDWEPDVGLGTLSPVGELPWELFSSLWVTQRACQIWLSHETGRPCCGSFFMSLAVEAVTLRFHSFSLRLFCRHLWSWPACDGWAHSLSLPPSWPLSLIAVYKFQVPPDVITWYYWTFKLAKPVSVTQFLSNYLRDFLSLSSSLVMTQVSVVILTPSAHCLCNWKLPPVILECLFLDKQYGLFNILGFVPCLYLHGL